METFRGFIAIDFPQNIRERIGDIEDQLKDELGKLQFRWVPPENLHLTLKFLGDVQGKTIEEITALLRTIGESSLPFEIDVRGFGVFPGYRRPRVIWLGIDSSNILLDLQNKIDQGTEKLGYQPDGRKYTPHLTIARLNRGVPKAEEISIGERLKQIKIGPIARFQVREMHLYSSSLSPDGAEHKILQSIKLRPELI